MRQRLTFLLALFIFLSSSSSFAQTISEPNGLEWSGGGLPWPPIDENYIEGTRYLYNEFIKGDIFFNDGEKISQLPLRLNLHNDEFEYMEHDSVFAIEKPSHIDKIVIGNEVFFYLDSTTDVSISGYVKKWNEGFPAIITKMETYFYRSEKVGPYTETLPDRFERAQDKHYLIISNKDVENISSMKKLIKILGDHEVELSDFAKKEKISAGNPEELNKLLDYYKILKREL